MKDAPEDLLVDAQKRLTQRVRERLRRFSVDFAESIEATRDEAFVIFAIATKADASDLHVELNVLGEQFNVMANEARFFIPLGAHERGHDVYGWVARCEQAVDALLESDLRIRVRKTLFGHTGAIWITGAIANESGWSGDAWACRGYGRELVFLHPWYQIT